MNGLVSLVGNTQKWLTTDSSGNQNFISRTVSISNTFHRVDIVYEQGVNVQFYMDGILDATSTSNLPTGTLYATFYSGRCNGGDQISLKWICIGKYDATPPIVTIDPTVQSQLESTQQSQSTPSQHKLFQLSKFKIRQLKNHNLPLLNNILQVLIFMVKKRM